MQVQRLKPGEKAPDDSDRVTVNLLPSGNAGFSGVTWAGGVAAHFVHQNNFETAQEAEQAALEYAAERQVSFLYVEYPPTNV